MKKFILLLGILFSSSHAAAEGILKVGSTFDYPPLTDLNYLGQAQGQDINIIKKFAKERGYTIKFIHTSWTNLSNDLNNNTFDVAVGGITATKERAKLFEFSSPIRLSRKAPFIRCADLDKYNSLAAINNKKTKIVENKGATNEKFAKKVANKAELIIVPNNKLPFEYLINRQADVFFTDIEEINYHHKQTKQLCEAKIELQFPATQKVFLFAKTAKGKQWQKEFNTWWLKR